MAFAIIGSQIDTKVLQRQNFSKESNGLETIIESYAIKTVNRDALVPDKNTTHPAFSSSSIKYPRMVVESVTTEEQDGGVTQMLVTFVGTRLSSGLPPAIVRLIPTPGAGIYGPDCVVEAEYLTDLSETQFITNGSGGQIIPVGLLPPLGSGIKMPSSINGTVMPSDPRTPFEQQTFTYAIKYHGYLQQSIACERRGLFLVARVIFVESQSGLFVSGATPFSSGRKA